MSPTSWVTFPPNSKVRIDHTAFTDWDGRPTSTEARETSFDPFLRSISQFSDSTGDGGVLLHSSMPFLLAWSMCIQIDHISRILPRVLISAEISNRTVVHPLSLKQTPPVLSPHLVAIQWIKEVTGFSQE